MTAAEIIAEALAAAREQRTPTRELAEAIVGLDDRDEFPFGTSSRDRAHARQAAHVARSMQLVPSRCPACDHVCAEVDLVDRACPSCSTPLVLRVGLIGGDVWLDRDRDRIVEASA